MSGLLPERLWKDLVSRFDGIYENGIRAIQNKLDRKAIGFDADSLLKSGGRSINKKRMKLFIETAIKWRTMTDKEAVSGEGRCQSTRHCPASNRISFIMELFSEHFLTQTVYRKEDEEPEESHYLDLFTECLSEYDAVSLLNDYDHIKTEHDRKANDRLRDCHLIGPYTECSRSLRLLRENMVAADDRKLKYHEFAKGLDHRHRVLLEITVKVHSFLNHSIDDDDDDEQQKEEVSPLQTANVSSKFVIEMDGGTLSKEQSTKMEGVMAVLTRCGVSKEHRLAVSKHQSQSSIISIQNLCEVR